MILETCYRGYRSSQSNEIKTLTQQIDHSFKETARSVFLIGRCLYRLKQLLPHKEFLELIDERWSMSHMSAHRLVTCYLTFKDQKSRALLSTKPSVMYIISTLDDSKKVAALAAGKKIQVSGEMKAINELTVKEARTIKENGRTPSVRREDSKDRRLAENFHEEIATAFEKLDDIAKLIKRFTDQGLEIQKKDIVKDYLVLTMESLREILCLLS